MKFPIRQVPDHRLRERRCCPLQSPCPVATRRPRKLHSAEKVNQRLTFKTAKALGLEVPPSFYWRVDEVIEQLIGTLAQPNRSFGSCTLGNRNVSTAALHNRGQVRVIRAR